jgi:hypothetical protein
MYESYKKMLIFELYKEGFVIVEVKNSQKNLNQLFLIQILLKWLLSLYILNKKDIIITQFAHYY